MKIGFIGLGIMGKPMVKNLLAEGYDVTVYDLNTEAIRELELRGAKPAGSPAETSIDKELIFTMLPSHPHVESVVFGDEGAVQTAQPGAIIVDMSSISPVYSKQFAKSLGQRGIFFMDAPVSGGEPKAIDGTLAIMVGGEKDVFEKVYPVLSAMGEQIVLVGETGAGTTAKLANQIMVNVNIAAMSEALVLAAKAGIDVEKMYQAIRGGLAGSAVLDAKVPLILERNFIAGGRIDINAKDLKNVLDTGDAIGAALPLSSQVHAMFEEMKAEGKGADDHGGLVQHYEKLASVTVQKGVTS
ncbi:2-hydroxy-3-oxopropionate reductase [Jeotgalibacillus sp. S-D1]|uniref:2-hydroxy-3-oxopropionate reductase n=1 Tax=Jeotgalibacillus sp. S-D1 TaxID=2552189 RepID=UPI00105A19BE|nr:2-hydroxy-3-oxopropionate reductase [Jeotgalibacillus sp. S-D1]TDL32929.1 2-hydroxy-3-oxopropionate reductase [Jeotgalibacillus sp. S-D1]